MKKWTMRGLAVAILFAVAWIYFPVTRAGFVWDDWPSFRDLQGDRWLHYVFRDFNQWTVYFRPLTVAFLALQVKLFHGAPGPMHAVSLGLHLVNVALAGMLAFRVGALAGATSSRQAWTTLACMLLYGMHPALIETVSWIGCQFDLMATLFTLLGLVANTYIQRAMTRAFTLAALFFLAACSKEAAVVFPVLVALFDVALFAHDGEGAPRTIAHRVIQRNWRAYAGMLGAGVVYLAARHWALNVPGHPAMFRAVDWSAQLQEICLTYLCYLKVIVWPMAGIGPLHPENGAVFQVVTTQSLLACVASISIVITGIYLAVKRRSALGFVILAATIALLPVLRVIPVSFDLNLYHERYATLAIAVICSLIPLFKWPSPAMARDSVAVRAVRLLAVATIALWTMFCMVDIRTLLPHWSSDAALWRWAMALDPYSQVAKDNLFLSFQHSGNVEEAQKLADQLLADPATCTSCMLHIAEMSLDQNDAMRATVALDRAGQSLLVKKQPDARQIYYRELGRLLIHQGRYADAQHVLEASLAIKPADPNAQAALATAKAASVNGLDEKR
ncbi:hypothetical protein [Dyella sp. C11]|uniref:tetratricopeptide repeat protein n=1 Tax=Dyella sp. C11 TaxID=2126991 RepID=UPI000D65220E|nr:hypothetical protein [Dyella sp. C11]